MSFTPSQWVAKNQKALNILLEKATPEAKEWVNNFLTESGSALEDPFCSQIAANAYLAYVMRNKPVEVRDAFEIAEAKMLKQLGTQFDAKKESYEQALSAELEARIARMAERLIAQQFDSPSEVEAEGKSVKSQKFAIHPVAIAILSGAVGLALGLFSSFFLNNEKPISSTATDSHILNWAKSKQGEFARQLIEWNGARLLSRNCETEARANNITLTVKGIQATRGVCAVFVRDPRNTKPQQVTK